MILTVLLGALLGMGLAFVFGFRSETVAFAAALVGGLVGGVLPYALL